MMGADKEEAQFRSGPGWQFESMTFCRDPGLTAEFRLIGAGGRRLCLNLRGLRSPEAMIKVLYEFDEFEIIEKPPSTPYAEFGRFVCRFYLDGEKYETIVDGFEAHEEVAEPPAAGDRDKPHA